MKYIIEFEDEYSMNEGGMKYHQCKQVPYWSVSHGIIKNLTPYIEPDRKAIEDEVWEFVRTVTDMTERDLCFGFPLPTEVTTNLTYQEAKSLFEKWMENENEIHVGDEIYSDGDYEKATVMEIHGDGSVSVYTKNGCIEHWWNKMHNLKKTGRHFPEAKELLQKMRGEEE